MNARPDPSALGQSDRRLAPPARRAPSPDEAMPVHDARALTGQGGQARILLDGQVYSLRITRAGKLILTK